MRKGLVVLISMLCITATVFAVQQTTLPPGIVALIPVQTTSIAVTAIAQAPEYPFELWVISARGGNYGLFEIRDDTRLVYGPAVLDPTSLAVSWDGRHAILSVKQGDYYKLLLLVDAYKSVKTVPLTNGPGNDLALTLSPDKSFVAFISDRDGQAKLYGLRIDHPELIGLPGGPRPVQLFPGPGEERSPAFSEHGLVFLSNLMGTWDLWVLEGPNYDSPRRVLANVDPESPVAWVGDRIFVVRDGTPGLVSRDGGFSRPLIGGPKQWWKSPGAPHVMLQNSVIYRVKFPSPLSPDLAFFRIPPGQSTAELWLATLEGKEWKVADQVPIGEAAWSPDGERLAYLRRGKRVGSLPMPEAGYRSDWYELWIANADGTDARCLRTFSPYGGEYEVHSLAWGPRGDRLYFALAEGGTPVYELHSIRLDGSGLETVFGGVCTCDVHPNGIVTGGARGPYLYSYDIASDKWTSYWEFGQLSDAVFSPSAKYGLALADGALVLLDCTARSERVLLPSEKANAGRPSWSPDEKKFAYVSDWDGDTEIWTYDLVSGTATQLTDNNYADNSPAWSPDGKYIAYVSEENVFPAIRVFSLQDGKTWSITKGEHKDVHPIWRSEGAK